MSGQEVTIAGVLVTDASGKQTTESIDAENADGSSGMAVSHPDEFAQEEDIGTSNQHGTGVDQSTIIQRVTGTTEVVVSLAPCSVFAIIENQGSTGHVSLRNAAAIGGGATPLIDAGTDKDCKGAPFTAGLTVQGSEAGADFTVLARPRTF